METKIKTIFLGQSRIQLPEVDSTNLYAQNIISKSKPPEGTVITTDFQTGGRGQIGRGWFSSKGKNLLCSTILYPKWMLAKDQFQLNIAISCAVRSFVSSSLIDSNVYIKWPNDIYISNKKTAGILIQNTLSGAYISSTIVGIGVNVNESEFPDELPNPTSLSISTTRLFDIKALYIKLFEDLERYYLMLKGGKYSSLMTEYILHLYGRDVPLNFIKEDGSPVTGIIQHVEANGKLIILINGKEQSFSFREIRLDHSK